MLRTIWLKYLLKPNLKLIEFRELSYEAETRMQIN